MECSISKKEKKTKVLQIKSTIMIVGQRDSEAGKINNIIMYSMTQEERAERWGEERPERLGKQKLR